MRYLLSILKLFIVALRSFLVRRFWIVDLTLRISIGIFRILDDSRVTQDIPWTPSLASCFLVHSSPDDVHDRLY